MFSQCGGMADSPGMGAIVVGGGTLVGSGGAGPQGSGVSVMSSRAMSLNLPPFFQASNSTYTGHMISQVTSDTIWHVEYLVMSLTMASEVRFRVTCP